MTNARLNITLNKNALDAIKYLTKEFNKNKSQIISQALIDMQKTHRKENRKALWKRGLQEASKDKEYLAEQIELANVGINDGIH